MGYAKWFALGKGKKRKRTYKEDPEYPPDDYHDYHGLRDDIDEGYGSGESDESDESDEFVDAVEYITHPPNSDKNYKSILLENGLSVLLIEDPCAFSSSAAVAVRYGSIHDPSSMNGLAHLVEHMLFNGTHENPGINEFRELVNMHGGEVFAYTDFEYSGYSFSLDAPGFEAALRMFANMFISPLMRPDLIASEIKTIDQEFELMRSFYNSSVFSGSNSTELVEIDVFIYTWKA